MLFHRPLSTLCWEKIGMTWHNNVDKNTIIQKGKDQWKKPMYIKILLVSASNIWKERNNLLFKGLNPGVESWLQRVKSDLLLPIHRTKEDIHSFIFEFVDSL
jgi:hypothetical protein